MSDVRQHPTGCSRSRVWPTGIPTVTRRSSVSIWLWIAANTSRCSVRTGPGRRRWCFTATACSPREPVACVCAASQSKRDISPRSAAESGSCSKTPTTSSSCRPSTTTWRSARRTSVCIRADLDACVDAALTAVGMTGFERRTPHHLSFGQRRRVAMASVLAVPSGLLVLDEPSSNLDPASRRELADIVHALHRHCADGDPRPALRTRAVPAFHRDRRRCRGSRWPHR